MLSEVVEIWQEMWTKNVADVFTSPFPLSLLKWIAVSVVRTAVAIINHRPGGQETNQMKEYEQLTLWSQDVLDDLVVPVAGSSAPDGTNHQTEQEEESAYTQLSLPEVD